MDPNQQQRLKELEKLLNDWREGHRVITPEVRSWKAEHRLLCLDAVGGDPDVRFGRVVDSLADDIHDLEQASIEGFPVIDNLRKIRRALDALANTWAP